MQPEDAAKGVNLRPPEFFVASSASQRNIDSLGGAGSAVRATPERPLLCDVLCGELYRLLRRHFCRCDTLESEASKLFAGHGSLFALYQKLVLPCVGRVLG